MASKPLSSFLNFYENVLILPSLLEFFRSPPSWPPDPSVHGSLIPLPANQLGQTDRRPDGGDDNIKIIIMCLLLISSWSGNQFVLSICTLSTNQLAWLIVDRVLLMRLTYTKNIFRENYLLMLPILIQSSFPVLTFRCLCVCHVTLLDILPFLHYITF